ncbi:MAG: signal peptidase II [Chloroflexi bacterium]|nr:MAG: signal peptidase II [Chloroflexota bacterium]
MKKYIQSVRWLFVIAIVIIILDQVTKALIRANLAYGEIWAPWDWMLPYARLIHITNTGVAFGLFKGANLIFMFLAIIVSIGIIYYYPMVPKEDRVIRLALSLQLAGAVGNLVDRIRLGQVTDFISVGTFPVWNVADSSITIGVFILLLGVWLQERREKNRSKSSNSEQPIHESGSEN